MRLKLANWAPLFLCASLSLICMSAILASRGSTAGLIPFLCFLPMCFFFVANVTSTLRQEIRELREQVATLQAEKARSKNTI